MDVDCGSARDRLGRTLGGKYHLKAIIGAGGTAVVYRASSPDGGMVAVKVLHDYLSRSEEVCRRFVREGQIGNVLKHPGAVRVLDHGFTEEQCPYLALELLAGESMEERRVRLGGRLDMREALDFCDQLLAVLEVAHAKNVVHRDIKPSNLFVMKDGTLKVLDFGIARITDETSATSTKTGQTIGTPAFMPPEQALSRPGDVDGRTDIWSVGATLFTLLSGQHVHIAETSSEHLVKAATLHARSLASALPGVPSNVEALVARALAFDKTERWSSAKSMREELLFVRAEPGRRIGTSTSPPPERTPGLNTPTFVAPMMRIYDEAATISSSLTSGDSTSAMALSSDDVAYDRLRRRGKWLLPVAVASTALLVLMSALVLVLATKPSRTAAAPAPTTTNAPSPAVDIPPPAIVLPPAPLPPAAVETAPSAARAAPPLKAAATSTKKAPNRKDVYRPF